jgi:glycosyltransferase involved in cell wall biosynthesis
MIRVAHLLNELQPSGAEQMLASSRELWDRRDIEPVIVGAGDRHPFAETLRARGYHVETVHASTRTPAGLSGVARALRRIRPDVVHFHAEQSLVPLTSIGRATPAVRLMVRSVHSTFGAERDPGYLRKRRRRMQLVGRLGVRQFACSSDVAEHELAAFGRRLDVIENWVDTAAIGHVDASDRTEMRHGLGIPPRAFVVLLVGNCAPVKRHELAMEAAASSGRDLFVLHVGDDSRMDSLERVSSDRLVRESRLVELGFRTDVADLMTAADAVAIPSSREGFSLVAAEALCAGTPIVASAALGLRWLGSFESPSIVSHEVDEWTVAFESLAAGEGPSDRALLADRDTALDRFSPERGTDAWAAVYSSYESA